MENHMAYSSQDSQSGRGGAGDNTFLGMDFSQPSKVRSVSVSVPKNRSRGNGISISSSTSRVSGLTSTSTSGSGSGSGSGSKPSRLNVDKISSSQSKLNLKSTSTSKSTSSTSQNKATSSSTTMKAKKGTSTKLKSNPNPDSSVESNDPDDFFKGLHESNREISRVCDKLEYVDTKDKSGKKVKSQNGSDQTSGMKKKKGMNGKISLEGNNYRNGDLTRDRDEYRDTDKERLKDRDERWKPIRENDNVGSKSSKPSTPRAQSSLSSSSTRNYRSQILSRAQSLEVSPDEEDEMCLGSTPPENMHQGYDDYRSLSRSPEKTPTSSAKAKGKANSTSNTNLYSASGRMVKKKKDSNTLIPDSDDERAIPRFRTHGDTKETQGRGKKRSSEDDSDSAPAHNRHGKKKTARRRIIGSDISDDEKTPQAKSKSRNSPTSKRDIENENSGVDIEEDPLQRELREKKEEHKKAGDDFFNDLQKLSSDGEFDWDVTDNHIDVTKIMEEGLDDDEERSEEDKAYLAPYKSKTKLCPYCSGAYPTNPSANLLRQEERLHSLSTPAPTSANPHARHLTWQKHIEFCALHLAETSVIPLGIRSGYPERIDFINLDRRLETGWIRDRLDDIVSRPETSKVFNEVEDQINEVGKSQWSGLKWQSKPENLESVKPGYFGDVGRNIMIHHFLSMRRWGYLPTLKSTDPHYPPSLDPLSWIEFVTHVLVPEASHLLIMSDQGYHHNVDHDGREERYEEARKIRKESVHYGTWKFREDDEDLQSILENLQDSKNEKKSRLKTLRKIRKDANRTIDDRRFGPNDDNNENENDSNEQSLESNDWKMVTPKPKKNVNSDVNDKHRVKKDEDVISIDDSPNKTPVESKYKSRSKSTLNSSQNSYNDGFPDNDRQSSSKRNIHNNAYEEDEVDLKSSQTSTDYGLGSDNDEFLLEAAEIGY